MVEVVSPANLASETLQKALDYLDAGARLVWIVDPVRRTVTVYRSRSDIRILVDDEILDGGDVLPALRVAVATLSHRGRREPSGSWIFNGYPDVLYVYPLPRCRDLAVAATSHTSRGTRTVEPAFGGSTQALQQPEWLEEG